MTLWARAASLHGRRMRAGLARGHPLEQLGRVAAKAAEEVGAAGTAIFIWLYVINRDIWLRFRMVGITRSCMWCHRRIGIRFLLTRQPPFPSHRTRRSVCG